MQRGYVGFPFPTATATPTPINTVATVTAGEAISKGSIVSVAQDGLAYYTGDPTVTSTVSRPVYNPTETYTTYNQNTNYILNADGTKPLLRGSASISSAYSVTPTAILSNENTVVVWQDSSPSTIRFALVSTSNIQIGNPINVTTATGSATMYSFSVAALTGGGFAIGVLTDVSPYGQYAVYDNNGNVVKALTTISATNITAYASTSNIQVAALSNGGFVLVYQTQNVNGVYFSIYDATGTVTTASTAIASGVPVAAGGINVRAFTATQGGGFIVTYATSATGSRIIKYSNAGAIVVASQQIGAGNSSYSTCLILSNGGFATASSTLSSTSGQITITCFNASGTQLYQGNPGTAVQGTFYPFMANLSNGNFAVSIGNQTTNTDLAYFYSTGSSSSYYAYVLHATIALGNQANQNATLLTNPSGGVIYITQGLSAYYFDANCTLINTSTYPSTKFVASLTSGSAYVLNTSLGVKGSTTFIYANFEKTTTNLVTGYVVPYIPKVIPIGVSATSVSSGSQFQIITSGYASLTSPFSLPYTANAQSLNGQKLNVIGSSVNLQGALSTTSSPLN